MMEPGLVASGIACPIREMRVALHVCDKDVQGSPGCAASPLPDDSGSYKRLSSALDLLAC
jgi:hypothetical protein